MKKFLLLSLIFIFSISVFSAINVNSGLSHKFSVVPGEEVSEVIRIANVGNEPVNVMFYKTDYFYYFDGSQQLTDYATPSSLEQSNADWISIQSPKVLISPGEEIEIPFVINIPDYPTLKGTYWSMIMVEPFIEDPEVSEGEIAIKTITRYGIQIKTDIGEPESGDKQVKIISKNLSKNENTNYLQLVLQNTGIFSLKPSITVRVYDNETGSLIGEFQGSSGGLYPETSKIYTVPFEDLQPGEYRIIVLIQDGDEVWGAQYTASIM